MEALEFGKLFPLFNAGSAESLTATLAVSWQNQHPAGCSILTENGWGKAVYFILQGWGKVRYLQASGDDSTLAILGPGEFFGEMSVLDEAARSTDVVALSEMEVLCVPAQKFIQLLIRDSQLHYRFLQLMVRRVRQANLRFEFQRQSPAVKLANTLVALGQNYGHRHPEIEKNPTIGMVIFNIPIADLADVSDTSVDDTAKIMAALESKGWIEVDQARQQLYLLNVPQLMQLAGQVP
jgi:CRP/FNR family transcriptional regulator, cyclic AMP receptor protein